MGFEIEEFGNNTFKINAVPLPLDGMNLFLFLDGLATEYKDKTLTTGDVLKEKLMQSACKAALKGGESLSNAQIEKLFAFFAEKNIPLKCPHGRPVYIIRTKNEIEKLFRRKI
jgi:DNA mismatch repair protein MutL